MKQIYTDTIRLAAGALILAGAFSCLAQNSPVGTWDFVISGPQKGVAYLSFSTNNTITGFEVLTFITDAPDPNDEREGTPSSRGPLESPQNTSAFSGFTPLAGQWTFDEKGRTIGFLQAADGSTNTTNVVITAGISFVAKVSPGKRMTMKTTQSPTIEDLMSKPLHTTARGVPFQRLADIGGSYSGDAQYKVTDSTQSVKQRYTEFLTFTNMAALISSDPLFLTMFPEFASAAGSPAVTNLYFVTGAGPGNTNWGVSVLSSQKRLGLVSRIDELSGDGTTLRSLEGSVNAAKGTANLRGNDSDDSRIQYKLRSY